MEKEPSRQIYLYSPQEETLSLVDVSQGDAYVYEDKSKCSQTVILKGNDVISIPTFKNDEVIYGT